MAWWSDNSPTPYPPRSTFHDRPRSTPPHPAAPSATPAVCAVTQATRPSRRAVRGPAAAPLLRQQTRWLLPLPPRFLQVVCCRWLAGPPAIGAPPPAAARTAPRGVLLGRGPGMGGAGWALGRWRWRGGWRYGMAPRWTLGRWWLGGGGGGGVCGRRCPGPGRRWQAWVCASGRDTGSRE